MDHFAGLDVSVKETSICIVDDAGKIVREVKVASEPEALLAVLKNLAYHFKRIGLEAGPLSQWLFSALAEAGSPPAAGAGTLWALGVVCHRPRLFLRGYVAPATARERHGRLPERRLGSQGKICRVDPSGVWLSPNAR
jgi:hypothetical protein